MDYKNLTSLLGTGSCQDGVTWFLRRYTYVGQSYRFHMFRSYASDGNGVGLWFGAFCGWSARSRRALLPRVGWGFWFVVRAPLKISRGCYRFCPIGQVQNDKRMSVCINWRFAWRPWSLLPGRRGAWRYSKKDGWVFRYIFDFKHFFIVYWFSITIAPIFY